MRSPTGPRSADRDPCAADPNEDQAAAEGEAVKLFRRRSEQGEGLRAQPGHFLKADGAAICDPAGLAEVATVDGIVDLVALEEFERDESRVGRLGGEVGLVGERQ